MKKEYDKKKKLVIFILTAVAVCLAGGLCFYLVKIGTPKEPEKEPVKQTTEQMEVTVPEIDITKEPEALEETKSEAAESSGQETEQPESSESETVDIHTGSEQDIVKSRALALPKGDFAFERALGAPGVSLICEVKKASPSKGLISPDFPYLDIARDYAAAGAAAISCLTEPDYFLGDDRYLQEIAAAVPIPVLRKDFTLYDYQIYEAKVLGAGAVLLICALLDTDTLRRYIEICDTLGLSALVEAHDHREIASALAAGARVIGVNNRNLKDFTVDVHNSSRYRALVPAGIRFVSESGMTTPADIEVLCQNGTDAALIGEALMRAPNRRAAVEALLR